MIQKYLPTKTIRKLEKNRKKLLPDIGQQAAQNCDPCGKGNKLGKPHYHLGFLPGDNAQTVGQEGET